LSPEVIGVEGVVAAYQNGITKASLYGPTNFAPLLMQLNNYCVSKAMDEN